MRALVALLFPAVALVGPALGDPAGDEPTRKALVLGLDGLRRGVDSASTPNLDRLVVKGAMCAATNAWTPQRAWNGHSATNWGVLLTGVSPARSGLTRNDDETHWIGRDNPSPRRVESFFGLLDAARPELTFGVTNTWGGIRGAPRDILGQDTSVCDFWFHPTGSESSVERDRKNLDAVIERLARDDAPDVWFVHLSQIDAAGHAHTYGSDEYRATVERVDGLVGELVAAIDARVSREEEEWLLIITSDHGGPRRGKGHADNEDPEVRWIPMMIVADGVPRWRLRGASLYDVAPTVLDWFGVEARLEGRSLLPGGRHHAPPELTDLEFRFEEVSGIGKQEGIVRRDPSDVVEHDGRCYVWYSRVDQSVLAPEQQRLRTSGYVASIWYATSDDEGRNWTERGEALGRGAEGTFDAYAVFTPNVLRHGERWYLYYTGVKPSAAGGGFANDDESDTTAIGVAVADSPGGIFTRLSDAPVLEVSTDPAAFDSYRVDDASMLVHDYDGDGELEIGLYYKGRSRTHGAKGPRHTCTGLAVAETPAGPYARLSTEPLFERSHEVLIWAHDGGLATLASISKEILFARDAVRFVPVGRVTNRPNAPGIFRPSFTIDAPDSRWGVDMVHDRAAPYLRRYAW